MTGGSWLACQTHIHTLLIYHSLIHYRPSSQAGLKERDVQLKDKDVQLKERDAQLKVGDVQLQLLEGEKNLWVKREKELEKEKAALHLKLEKTISALEERTSATIERATSKLQDKDVKVGRWVDGSIVNGFLVDLTPSYTPRPSSPPHTLLAPPPPPPHPIYPCVHVTGKERGGPSRPAR